MTKMNYRYSGKPDEAKRVAFESLAKLKHRDKRSCAKIATNIFDVMGRYNFEVKFKSGNGKIVDEDFWTTFNKMEGDKDQIKEWKWNNGAFFLFYNSWHEPSKTILSVTKKDLINGMEKWINLLYEESKE